jgi:hypothetical protein
MKLFKRSHLLNSNGLRMYVRSKLNRLHGHIIFPETQVLMIKKFVAFREQEDLSTSLNPILNKLNQAKLSP